MFSNLRRLYHEQCLNEGLDGVKLGREREEQLYEKSETKRKRTYDKRCQYRDLQINAFEAQDLGCKSSGIGDVTGGVAT